MVSKKPPMSEEVSKTLAKYPMKVRNRLQALRSLIFEVATELHCLEDMEECLKWGEPSYLVKGGSTIRMDWKQKHPEQYALYFNCKSKLVETFKELYGHSLCFEGNRAIVLSLEQDLPQQELRHCILLTMTYHQRKDLPLLGA